MLGGGGVEGAMMVAFSSRDLQIYQNVATVD
jgi:hypothetical protein